MTRAVRLLIATMTGAAAVWPFAAQAHAPIEGVGTFYAYFLHPVLVPEFAVLVVGTALLLGQQGRSASRTGLIAISAGLVTGFFLMSVASGLSTGMVPALFAALLAGAALTLDRPLPQLVPVLLAFATGLLIALDPDIGTLAMRDSALAISGLACGSLVITVIAAGLTSDRQLPWLRIGQRIVGAWIVAASVLVLALQLVVPAR